jgi:hypothetical protein
VKSLVYKSLQHEGHEEKLPSWETLGEMRSERGTHLDAEAMKSRHCDQISFMTSLQISVLVSETHLARFSKK